VRRPVFIGDICALVRRQRILDADALAEGEELDSNILSQDFAPVRTTMVRRRESAAKYLKKVVEPPEPRKRSREKRRDRTTRF
jgi:hypothetical protein